MCQVSSVTCCVSHVTCHRPSALLKIKRLLERRITLSLTLAKIALTDIKKSLYHPKKNKKKLYNKEGNQKLQRNQGTHKQIKTFSIFIHAIFVEWRRNAYITDETYQLKHNSPVPANFKLCEIPACLLYCLFQLKGEEAKTRPPETLKCSKSKTCRARKPFYLIRQAGW